MILTLDVTVFNTIALGATAQGITDDVFKILGNNDNLLNLYD